MRLRAAGPLLLLTACVRGELDPPARPPSGSASAPAPAAADEYLVGDPPGEGGIFVALGPGTFGTALGRRRIVVGKGPARVADEVPPEPFLGAVRVPARLGTGYLFWTASVLYRAPSFEGHLEPLVRVPGEIASVSLPPNGVLVHARSGERWALSLRGERVPIGPLGAVDAEALDDGRALAFRDDGAVLASLDGGARWDDVTAELRAPITGVTQRGGELWAMTASGGSRLERDGRLTAFDPVPDEDRAIRPVDPAWRDGSTPPLRAAFAEGAPVDDRTALLVAAGDLFRVDLRSGAVRGVVAASLPPDARCRALAAPDDLLFLCGSRSTRQGFVVTQARTGTAAIERAFATGRFGASDDGGLLVEAPCTGGAATVPTVCVRQPGGGYRERDVLGLTSRAGGATIEVGQWIPRADGGALAIVLAPELGLYDTTTEVFEPWPEATREAIAGFVEVHVRPVRAGTPFRLWRGDHGLVDEGIAIGPDGILRGWRRDGGLLAIGRDGHLVPSPYTFVGLSFAGRLGLALAEGGRLYQSTDHGASFTEVAAPPGGVEGDELGPCSAAGCDLGTFYRRGWPLTPPRPASVREVKGVPLLGRPAAPGLACQATAPATIRVLARTGRSPEDLGLGLERLPVDEGASVVRDLVTRGIVAGVHEVPSDPAEALPALRAVFSGYAVESSGAIAKVTGPEPDLLALRRRVAYVAPFDPAARVIRTGLAVREIVASARRAGANVDELLSDDPTRVSAVVPLLSREPRASSDVAIHNPETGVLALAQGERTRFAHRPAPNREMVVSGALLARDEAAFLELAPSGATRVFSVAASGAVTDLFTSAVVESETASPANLDALAVGPGGDLAVLRTASGSEPASANDPALVLAPGKPPLALAPWSTLALADEPACQAEPGGYRAVLQLVRPWLRASAGLRAPADVPMLARVRWTTARVCLEAVELAAAPVTLPQGGEIAAASSWIVGRGPTWARVAVADGVEWRQPLACTLTR